MKTFPLLVAVLFLALSCVAAGCISAPLISVEKTDMVNLTTWYLETPVQYAEVNGVQLAYREFGTENAEPMILIMGYTGVMDVWDPCFIAELADTYHVYVYDHRSMGYSSNDPSAEYTIRQLTDDCAALMQALGHPKMYVFGHSMGSIIGQNLAVYHPESIIRIVLASTTPSPDQPYCAKLMSMVNTAIADPDTKDGIYLQSLAIRDSVSVFDQLGNVTSDVLVLVGTDDDLTPLEGNSAVAQEIPGAWYIQLKGCSHSLWREMPTEVADIVTTFYQTNQPYSP